MGGDGPFSKPTRLINRLQRTTKKTAWVVMFQLSQPTGCTYKVTRSSNRSNPKALQKFVSKDSSQGESQCRSICCWLSLELDSPPRAGTCGSPNPPLLPSLSV